MDWLQVVVLAVVQGFTEFLPVSSSAHLILIPALTPWNDQGLAFDVALHLGSLLAVMACFRHQIIAMLQSSLAALRGRGVDTEARLALALVLATLPVCAIGFVLHDLIEGQLRTTPVIAAAMIGFGLLLGYADRGEVGQRDEYRVRGRDIAIIGLAQALALIPGTSRSGITMTAALLLGLGREAAARFSFLLSIPVIILASGMEILTLSRQTAPIDWATLLWGTALAGISAYLCIRLFLAFITRLGMQPFVVYRLILGAWLLWLFYG
ncbi:undecaprenyl-diphosphate phosphatase [Vreelandella jeotgali]|uniref:undecaprenyl-diphosphate phosphatase n=1 Tax=Vreelandella jeotgali TaxID=553386 RepID=UPI000346EBEB|nr:undecaprenyl-diphosphate phosphatase [Halomonas jeotgali]